jgi:predicted MFS family arabinose efflux permease
MQRHTPLGANKAYRFSRYQVFLIWVLTFLQFTIILDFMILAPLGAILMPEMKITPAQFGIVVSVYAFSAGIAGLLAAGFADRFDRKRFLLFFYVGFLVGTLLCGVAPTYEFLLMARVITGLFGGVIGSIISAITTDLFPLQMRGRVMGFMQTAFAGSQILGLPIGLFLASHWGWRMPFLMIVAIASVVGVVIFFFLNPIDAHLVLEKNENFFLHLKNTLFVPLNFQAFATTALLSTGGYMLMPFGSAFTVHNLGISVEQLPMIYMCTGLSVIVIGPLVGRASDAVGKFNVFLFGSLMTAIMVYIYTHLQTATLALAVTINALMFVGIFSRIIPAQSLMSAIPAPNIRGSFMAISSSVQQISGGVAAVLGGLIVSEGSNGSLQNFPTLGWVVNGAMMITLFMVYRIHRHVPE